MENGFSVKHHTIRTADGYHLKLFRIDGILNEKHINSEGSFSWNSDFDFKSDETKTPILFQHGLIDSSDA